MKENKIIFRLITEATPASAVSTVRRGEWQRMSSPFFNRAFLKRQALFFWINVFEMLGLLPFFNRACLKKQAPFF